MRPLPGYDGVASSYVERFHGELRDKPFDVKMLEWLAERCRSVGPICDLGCGPGHVAAHLHDLGCDVCGIDLSSEMIRHARLVNPGIPFEEGDMRDLSAVVDSTYGGVAAFYSIVNLHPDELLRAFREINRVLITGGWLLLTFHVGEGARHLDEFLGVAISLDFYFFEPDEVRELLITAELDVIEVIERAPYGEEIEGSTQRAYVFACKPVSASPAEPDASR